MPVPLEFYIYHLPVTRLFQNITYKSAFQVDNRWEAGPGDLLCEGEWRIKDSKSSMKEEISTSHIFVETENLQSESRINALYQPCAKSNY